MILRHQHVRPRGLLSPVQPGSKPGMPHRHTIGKGVVVEFVRGERRAYEHSFHATKGHRCARVA